MPGTAVVDSGNYDLQIATGFNLDGFVLDDPIKGILAGYTTNTTRTNLITNPNFEVNTSPWTSTASNGVTTFVRSTDFAVVGSYSGKLTTTGTSGNLNVTFGFPTVTPSTTYTVSVYVRSSASFTHNLFVNGFTGFGGQGTALGSLGLAAVTSLSTGWTRNSVTITTPANCNSVSVVSRWNSANVAGNIFYIDAVILETGSTLRPYFDGTYAEPYTGYTLTFQQWASTANASISTATWGLTSTFINSDYVLDGSNEFASVLDSITTVTVKRGRRDIGDTFSAGTMTFTIQDVDGVFNPFDENSPYYNTPDSQPGLAPMREVKLIRYSSTNVPELSGARISTVLDLPEVDFPALSRDISTGTVELGHSAAYTVPAGTNVLQYIAQINDTAEFGRLFMSREGVLTFQDRIGNTLSASIADFHDDGTNYKYNGVGISFEADAVVNRVVVTGLNGNTATASDTGSIAQYFIQTDSITNSLLHEQTSINTAAAYLLNPQPEARYTSVETKFLMLTTAQKDTLATVEIGNTITVEKTFPSGTGTSQLAQELSVEGIEHYLDFATGHRILFSTAPTTIVFELILNNATYGTLDALNVLG